ncbi:MAG: hypothetical protein IT306_13310 [Chloroflexi bacterium]|nr:hypothetical protein [Chloroflexota bacterium]
MAEQREGAGAVAEAAVEGLTTSAPASMVVAVHGNGGGAHRFSLVTPAMLPGQQKVYGRE